MSAPFALAASAAMVPATAAFAAAAAGVTLGDLLASVAALAAALAAAVVSAPATAAWAPGSGGWVGDGGVGCGVVGFSAGGTGSGGWVDSGVCLCSGDRRSRDLPRMLEVGLELPNLKFQSLCMGVTVTWAGRGSRGLSCEDQ